MGSNKTPPNQQRWVPDHPQLGADVNFTLRKLADLSQGAQEGVNRLGSHPAFTPPAAKPPAGTPTTGTASAAAATTPYGYQQSTYGLWTPYVPLMFGTSGYTISSLNFQVAEYQIIGSIIFIRIHCSYAAGGSSTALVQMTTPPVPPADNLSTLTCVVYNANVSPEAAVCITNSNLLYITLAVAGDTFSANPSPVTQIVISGQYHV